MQDKHENIILHTASDFEFIKEKFDDDVAYTLKIAYDIYHKYHLWDFFRTYLPPSHHGYLWWMPSNPFYEEWEEVYKLFENDLIKKFTLESWEINFHMKFLQNIALNGFENTKRKMLDIVAIGSDYDKNGHCIHF